MSETKTNGCKDVWFEGAFMRVLVDTNDTGGIISMMEHWYPANWSPPLHVHHVVAIRLDVRHRRLGHQRSRRAVLMVPGRELSNVGHVARDGMGALVACVQRCSEPLEGVLGLSRDFRFHYVQCHPSR